MDKYRAWAGGTAFVLELSSRVGERLTPTDEVGIEIDRNSGGVGSRQGDGKEELHDGRCTSWLVGQLAW